MEAGHSSYKLFMLFKYRELLVLYSTLTTNLEQVLRRGRDLGSDRLLASLEPCPVPQVGG